MASKTRDAVLRDYFAKPQAPLRPIFTFLNGDNSWLMSFPQPLAERDLTGKFFYHIVWDPWLGGPSIFLSGWLIEMMLQEPAKVKNAAEVEQIARDIEAAAAKSHGVKATLKKQDQHTLDAIFIHGVAGDHFHPETLLQFSPELPIFTIPKVYSSAIALNHFKTVVPTKLFDGTSTTWQDYHPGAPLPEWINIFDLAVNYSNMFTRAIVLPPAEEDGKHELILHAPHGMHIEDKAVQTLVHRGTPLVRSLAFGNPLKDHYFLGSKQVTGVQDGMRIIRDTDARYWIKTGDSLLGYAGLLGLMVKDFPRTLEWAFGQEKSSEDERKKIQSKLVSVDNGGIFVLA